jgi:outer membrane protein assembly factor BamB
MKIYPGLTALLRISFSVALAFALGGAPAAAQGSGTIDSLAPSPAARSGYLEIFGSNFGAAGQVTIDGIAAFVSTWTSSRIVAYVPEGARTTDVPVVLVNPSGLSSNTVSLAVVARAPRDPNAPNDRVRWRFRMDAPYSLVRPVIAADETIYAVDVYGHLYALSPDGALLWLVNGAGNKGVTIGADGTIVASSETDVRSFNRDGSARFIYTQSPRALIDLGVAAGPDGNIYSVGTQGPGVFSLTLASTLRWTLPETYSRPLIDYGEIVFGPNGSTGQLYFYANNHLRAVDLSGRPVFTIAGAFGQPDVAPDGSVHGARVAYSPSGDLLWRFASPDPFGIASEPDIGSEGTHYYTESQGRVFALTPAGAEKWRATSTGSIGGPVVSPGNTLLVAGGADTLDKAGSVHGLSAADGSELWRVTLPAEDPTVFNPSTGQLGYNQQTFTRGRFSPDGATAYFMTATATSNNNTSRSFVYAIETGSPASALPGLAFYTLNPCRLIDTRDATGPYGGPALSAGQRTFNLAGRCGVPTTARALAINLTVVAPSQSGDLRVFAADSAAPFASAINFGANRTRTNNAILPVATDGSGGLNVHLDMGAGTAQLIVDLVGYFQ